MTQKRVIRSILVSIMSAIFLFTGIMKLAGSPYERALFAKWNYPLWFIYFTAACDIIFALGLLTKKLRRLSALILFLLLSTALLTNYLNKEELSLFTFTYMGFIMGILYFDATRAYD